MEWNNIEMNNKMKLYDSWISPIFLKNNVCSTEALLSLWMDLHWMVASLRSKTFN